MKEERNLTLFALLFMLLFTAADALAADAAVTAVGSFAFTNPETSVANGIRRAHIEMCDEDGWGVCSVFATGETNDDGSFTLIGTSGDWLGDLPEVEVRVFATSAGVEVSNGSAVYCFKTPTRQNVTNGSRIDFGRVTPLNGRKCTFGDSASGENGAWSTYQWSREAFDFLRGSAAPAVFTGLASIPGSGVSKQKVKWPASATVFNPDFSGFEVKGGEEVSAGRIINLYTLAALSRRLGAWDATHNDWDGYFGMTLAMIVTQYFGHRVDPLCLAADPTRCGTAENPPHTSHDAGGITPGMASIGVYWDLYDPASGGDHDLNGSTDNLQVPLDTLWRVERDYDPNQADPNDNHPSDVQEFGRGLIAKLPDDAARIGDIYDENHLPRP